MRRFFDVVSKNAVITAILNVATSGYTVQVSDRRVSARAVWDAHSNKSVVLHGSDGVVACSYTGLAYLGRLTTDHVIAEALVGQALAPGVVRLPEVHPPDQPIWRSLERAGQVVQEKLAAIPPGRRSFGVEIYVNGLVRTDGRLGPLLMVLRINADGVVPEVFRSPREGRLELQETYAVGGSAQAHLPDEAMHASIESSRSNKDDVALFVSAVRRVSREDSTVGPDCLAVTVLPARLIREGAADDAAAAIVSAHPAPDSSGVLFSPWFLNRGSGVVSPANLQVRDGAVIPDSCDHVPVEMAFDLVPAVRRPPP